MCFVVRRARLTNRQKRVKVYRDRTKKCSTLRINFCCKNHTTLNPSDLHTQTAQQAAVLQQLGLFRLHAETSASWPAEPPFPPRHPNFWKTHISSVYQAGEMSPPNCKLWVTNSSDQTTTPTAFLPIWLFFREFLQQIIGIIPGTGKEIQRGPIK